MSNCALCLQNKPLRKSHIIPKFAYAPVQDDIKRSLPIGTSNTPLRFVQSGIKTYLLCDDCEEIFCNYEKELGTFLKEIQNGSDRISKSPESNSLLFASNFNFDKIHKAILSIIWRLSIIPQSSFFDKYYLGTKNQERIRDLLLNNKPLPFFSYPITADKITIKGEPRDDLILCYQQSRASLGNVIIQTITLYGVTFNIYMKEDITPFFGKDKEILYLGGPYNPIQHQELSTLKIDPELLANIRSKEIAEKMNLLKLHSRNRDSAAKSP